MFSNNEGNFYAHIKEQIQIKSNIKSNKKDKFATIENRLLEIVDSLKITKYDKDIM